MLNLSASHFGRMMGAWHSLLYINMHTIRFESSKLSEERKPAKPYGIKVWCLGPDLNRHDPVKESQDFKSYPNFIYLFEFITHFKTQWVEWSALWSQAIHHLSPLCTLCKVLTEPFLANFISKIKTVHGGTYALV